MNDRTQPSNGSNCAAIRLLAVTRVTPSSKVSRNHDADESARHADFITCLTNGRETRATYDLRILCQPDRENRSRGKISMDLLCRLDGGSASESAELAADTAALLHAQFPEYAFGLLPAEEIARTLKPFDIGDIVSLTRRTSLESLDTLRSGRTRAAPGFLPRSREPTQRPSGEDCVYHVFPFLPGEPRFEVLFELLLSLDEPSCISVRLKPTALSEREEELIETQIGRCERYAQVIMGQVSEDLSGLRPTLRRQAELLQQYQQRMLFGLRDNAALLSIEIASPSAVPQQLIDVFGSLISAPAGGTRVTGAEPVQLYFAGGYDVCEDSDNATRKTAFETAQMPPIAESEAPPGLERVRHLFDSSEAALAFRWPSSSNHDFPGMTVRSWRTRRAPGALPDNGVPLGINRHRGQENLVYLGDKDRRRHAYVIGQTGTGKTTLLRNMILRDIEEGEGLCVVDPHGDLYADLLGRIPHGRRDDVVLLDPTDDEFPVGINLLECKSEAERYFVAQEIVGIFSKLLGDEYGRSATEYAGPIFYQQVRMNLLLLMSKPELPGTLLDLYSIFQIKDYWRKWTPVDSTDATLKHWVDRVLPKSDFSSFGSDSQISMGMYVSSKFEQLLFDPRLRNIFGQRQSTINIRNIVDEGKILLVNLAKGPLTEKNSQFLGMVFLAKLVATILARGNIAEHDRRPFHLYVDEFQSIATEGFTTLLSEARKFGVDLILANQFLNQVENRRIIDAIFGNVATLIAFRIGQSDADLLAPQFQPHVADSDLIALPNWQAYVRTLANGERTKTFNVATTLPLTPYDQDTSDEVRKLSRHRYGHPRESVEKTLFAQ